MTLSGTSKELSLSTYIDLYSTSDVILVCSVLCHSSPCRSLLFLFFSLLFYSILRMTEPGIQAQARTTFLISLVQKPVDDWPGIA